MQANSVLGCLIGSFLILLGATAEAKPHVKPTEPDVHSTDVPPTEIVPLWSGVAPGSEGFTGKEVYEKRENNGTDIGWLTGVSQPTLTLYVPDEQKRTGAGIVVCPGGGYYGLAIDHEGHAFAKWLCERGMVAGVLKYRHPAGKPEHRHPVPLNDAQRAMRIMRSRAEQWKIDPDKIGIAGFSAGGHLASTAGTHVVEGDAAAEDLLERVSSRANFLVLIYPVISMQDGVTHQGSKKSLLGESPDEELVRSLSNELQVTAETGPTFLVNAYDDQAVPAENSLLFYQALRKHQVPAEMHLYETGGHGFGMYRGDCSADCWPDLLEQWLRGRGLLK